MESQNIKAEAGHVMDGVEIERANQKQRERERERGASASELVLRVLALLLTLTAAVTLGVDKQTKVVPVKLLDTLPPLNVPVSAKWHYLSAFVYCVVSNGIACFYAAISLVLSLTGKKGLMSIVITVDLLMVALLFSSNGAAVAIGLIGYQGNTHARWNELCDVFDKFCAQAAASLVLSLLAAIVFLLLLGVASFRNHKKLN